MQQGYNNQFSTKDKLDIAQRMSQVLDLSKVYLGDYISDAQQFVRENKIVPSDTPIADAVLHVAGGEGDSFARIYYDGRQEPVDRDTYVNENIYNFLPQRFKTYKPNG